MKITRLCLIFSIAWLAIATSCAAPPAHPTPAPTATPTATPTPQPSPTPPPSTIENPTPLGETASIGIVDFSITGLVRPATEQVLAASSANPVPGEGMEYVLVDLVEVCIPPIHQECFIRVKDMRLIGANGVEYRPQNVLNHPFMMPNRHIQGGTTAYGYVAFIVAHSEEALIFSYQPDAEGRVYLATE